MGCGHREQGAAVAVLVLGVVPAAPSADRRQGVVTQLPVELGREALVLVFDVGLEVAVDVAVVGAWRDGAQLAGKRGTGAGDYTAGERVFAFHVVGDQGQAQGFVGFELQLATGALALVAIDVMAVGNVLDIAVVVTPQGAQRALEPFAEAPADAEAQAVLIAPAKVRVIHIAAGLLGDGFADDVQHTGRSVLAEQRTLRAAQHFDALQVEQVEG
ncbi:hypothetical protein D3C81_1397800 [compost metagenome]